ncbi:MAG TPA: pyruvate ferredoxin oxidoreductase [Firmicutes bacterium]|nr:pyruvate ferredoxin oxidoreductase [Bacillota bacterium]
MVNRLMTGNEAVALAVCLGRVQVVPAYPITPQTTVMEKIASLQADGTFRGEMVTVESENSALACCVGAAYAGARSFTATSSHGLAYMHELLHWAAGARLPLVLTNAGRALGAPWCIDTDQLDSLSQRDTGWVQLYCSSVQEILDTVLVAFRLAETARVPVMVVYDGYYLSHVYEPVSLPAQEQADAFLPEVPRELAFSPEAPHNHHGLANAALMAHLLQNRHLATLHVNELYARIDREFSAVTGRTYPAVEELGAKKADTVFVAAGATAQTIHTFIIAGRQDRVGLVRIKLFRPFPQALVADMLTRPHIRRVIVVDRNLSCGTGGIFAQEVKAALYGAARQPQLAELNLAGGLDLTPELLEKTVRRAADGEKVIWAVNL